MTNSEGSLDVQGLAGPLRLSVKKAYPNRQDLRVSDLCRIADGWECDVYAFTVASREAGEPRHDNLILRLYQGDRGAAKASTEFEAMRGLRDAGYPVPQVHFLETDPSQLGKSFIIMERIAGETLGTLIAQSTGPERQRYLRLFAKLFVDLHRLDWQRFVPDSSHDQLTGDVDRWLNGAAAFLDRFETPDFDEAFGWLGERAASIPPHPLAFVHQDFHPFNVLLRADGAPFVIDWTQADVSDPRLDLAWTLLLMRTIYGPDLRDGCLRDYENLAGAPVEAIEFFEAAAAVKRLASILISLRQGANKLGMRPGAEAQMTGQKRHLATAADVLRERTGLRIPAIDVLLGDLAA